MAKPKTTRKSSGSTSKKKSGKGGKKSTKSRKAPSSTLICEFCEKSMKDEKTKKLHERNCKKKVEEKKPAAKKKVDKDLDSAILKIKDEFEDQRQQMESQFNEREDKLHRELGEIREVLRLEMERRHAVRKPLEVPTPAKDEPIPEPVDQDTDVHPETPREDVPKAIDRIPIPLPTVPERKVLEDSGGPRVEVVEIGTIGPIAGEVAVAEKELDKEEIQNIVREEMEALAQKLEYKTETAVASDDIEELRNEIKTLTSEVAGLRTLVQDSSKESLKKEDLTFQQEFKRIDRELAKFSDKIAEIIDEIGFGESLSVSKIPPTILEIVYQATLDDLMKELVKTLGSQDAEKVSRLALEEVRLKTSGSELFKFDGRKIVTDDLAKSIEQDLISATQIQTTYDELLNRFLEKLPHHKAKNFRAMIKVKSQEFAVDRATVLTKKFEKMDKHLESTSQMLAALSAQISAKNLKLEEELAEIKEKRMNEKADVAEMDLLKTRLKEREEREAAITGEIGLLKAEVEMDKKLAKAKKEKVEKKAEALDSPESEVSRDEKSPKDSPEPKGSPEPAKKEIKEPEPEPDLKQVVLKAIADGASSKTAINRITGLEEKDILTTISVLVKDKKVVEKKVGKRFKYQTPDQAIDEELGKKEKATEKKDKPKKTETKPVEKEKPPEPEKKIAKKEKPKLKKKTTAKKDKVKETKEPVEKKPEEKKEPKAKPEKPKKEKKAEVKKKSEEKKEPPKKKEPAKKPPKKEPEKAKETVKETKEPEPDGSPESKDSPEPKVDDDKKKEPEGSPEPKPEEVEEKDEEPAPLTKSLEEMNEDELKVLKVMTEDGLTRSGIQSKVGKDIKYTSVLRALRVLIDSGYVGIVTKGRLTLYQKINVEKLDEKKKSEKNKEVK